MNKISAIWKFMFLMWIAISSIIVSFTYNPLTMWLVGLACIFIGIIATFMHNTSKNL